ncbi:uncharacterized protein LOC116425476 [Nomia melanderi]|uniref:uncharacterized protein LOC116425476 n=1 Tax=Nomia melanderi TaxID=2448451 RepID=UPI003FCE4D3A
MEIQTPYLDALQAIPGDTPGAKYKWIAKLLKERMSEYNSLEEVVESEKIPRILVPMVQVQAAKFLHKRDPTNQDNYAAIAEALKSEDWEVVVKALQAKCFFDGSNKTITNVEYFFNQLFPYVSMKARIRIIKSLSIFLRNEPALAEAFFTAVTSAYGLKQALPLLVVCSENFVYRTIVEKRIELSRKLVEVIFRKNPDLIVRYFKLSNPNRSSNDRKLHQVDILYMGDFLAALVHKRLDSFVELLEMHEKNPPPVEFNKKQLDCFLKNGKDHLLRKPKLFIDMIPLEMISASRMKIMFPKLFPETGKSFSTDHMLNYLHYYPEDEKADLLIKSYRNVYGKNIFDDIHNVTPDLLRLLPANERIRQARIKLEKDIESDPLSYRYAWRCYLPVEETIPALKTEIANTSVMEHRAGLVCQMICNCRVNNDDQALLEVLVYIRDRHKNEQSWFLMKVFEALLDLYDLPRLKPDIWAILIDIVLRAHVKNELTFGNHVGLDIVESAIYFRILNRQPIDQEIGILVDLKSERWNKEWNIIKNHPEYERVCMEACLNVAYQRYLSNKNPWKDKKSEILHDLVVSIYSFNDRHVKENRRVERMSIKNYSWLLKEIEAMVLENAERNYYIILSIRQILEKHEKDLFERIFPKEKENVLEITMENAYVTLKNNPESILSRWKEYLSNCQNNWHMRSARRFVRACRWYKEIPLKFLNQCLQDLANKKAGQCLPIIAMLVRGPTLTKIVDPLIPTDPMLDIHHEEARDRYNLLGYAISCLKFSNPPVPLTLLCRLCVGDYLSKSLGVMINVCRSSPLINVIAFAQTLVTQRVSVRKHGIRIMHMTASRDQLFDFLLSQWKIEEHYSIRDVLFSKVWELFSSEPGPDTWILISQVIATLTEKDSSKISEVIQLISNVPDEYIPDFVKLTLTLIDRLTPDSNTYYQNLSFKITPSVSDLLPEELNKELLRRFFFIPVDNRVNASTSFALRTYLVCSQEKFEHRMKIFTDMLVEAVKYGWNVPHPKKPRYFPTNYGLRCFMYQLISGNLAVINEEQLLDGFMNAFLSTLSPLMDPTSYLLLVYRKEQVSAETPTDFGVKVGKKLPQLIDLFSSQFLYFIGDVLDNLLSRKEFTGYEKEDAKLSVIEGLVKVGSVEAELIAAKLLRPVHTKDLVDRFDSLIKKFKEHSSPAIKSIACDIINQTSMSDFSFENS